MGFSDILKNVVFRGSNEKELIRQSVSPLDKVSAGIAAQITQFVLTGDNPAVLQQLQQHHNDDFAIFLNKPATLTWWWPSNKGVEPTKKDEKDIENAAKARSFLYQHVGASISPAILVRFGKVLSAACQNKNLTQTTDLVPAWFLYLLHDAFCTTLEAASRHEKTLAGRTGWTLDFLEQLLAEDELAAERVLPAIFDRKTLNDYYFDRLELLLKLPDLTDYLLAHVDAVNALPPQLSAAGNILLAQKLGTDAALKQTFVAVLVQLAVHSAKGVRTEAEKQLTTIDLAIKQQALEQLYNTGSNSERTRVVDLLVRSGEVSRPWLENAAKTETAKTVQQAIQQALSHLDTANQAATFVLPEAPDFTPFSEGKLEQAAYDVLASNYQIMLADAKTAAEEEIAENKIEKRNWKWRQNNYNDLKKLTDADLLQAIQMLNGETKKQKNMDKIYQIIVYKHNIQKLSEFSFIHALRLEMCRLQNRNMSWYNLQNWFNADDLAQLDLRKLADGLVRAGHPDAARQTALFCLGGWYSSLLAQLTPDLVWPFFAEHPEFLDEAFGLIPSKAERYQEFAIGKGLEALECFPVLPAHFVPSLLGLALGESKTYRFEAQTSLEKLPDISSKIEEALGSSKQEIRIVAAQWLMSLGNSNAIPALTECLKKEKRETVRAALLTSIQTLGGDISGYLTPAVLLVEAKKGLTGKAPASLAWFKFDALPVVTWQDSSTVAPEIIQWWVILACKLKEPAGNTLLNLYLGLLSPKSQASLAAHILHSFIQQDTRNPTEAEAIAKATQEAPARLQMYQNWFKNYPQYYTEYEHYTLDQAFAEIKRECLATYLGSAIADKGILALIWPMQGHQLVSQLQQYMRDHYQRRAQIEAMLMAAANSNDPVIIQLLLSVSRRYRTASVQTLARELVQEIANRNGWSRDELADRTIPTAGFDETGVLALQYGERVFTAKMDASFKVVLQNPEGKEVKALPEARKTDDAELIKEAKLLFSSCKKELKQVLDLQTMRLYEAMCAERQWPVAEWREYLWQHPIMNRLLQQLVWQQTSADGAVRTFRPTEDGSFINVEDDEVDLTENAFAHSKISLAHVATLSEADATAWVAHFKDYKIKPLFAQMTRPLPAIETQVQKNEQLVDITDIETRKGWLTDTFTFRGVLTKLGYQRAAAEDGGYFDHYFKEFNGLGMYVNITFSGNCLPEENVPAILYDLNFEKRTGKRGGLQSMNIADVPRILLAETYSDYLAVADACSGFDPEWEKKSPW